MFFCFPSFFNYFFKTFPFILILTTGREREADISGARSQRRGGAFFVSNCVGPRPRNQKLFFRCLSSLACSLLFIKKTSDQAPFSRLGYSPFVLLSRAPSFSAAAARLFSPWRCLARGAPPGGRPRRRASCGGDRTRTRRRAQPRWHRRRAPLAPLVYQLPLLQLLAGRSPCLPSAPGWPSQGPCFCRSRSPGC